jgi:lysophospholipase L1-like esterase
MKMPRSLPRTLSRLRFVSLALTPAVAALAFSFACGSPEDDDKGSGGSGAAPAAGKPGQGGAAPNAGGASGATTSGGSSGSPSVGGASQGGTSGSSGTAGSAGAGASSGGRSSGPGGAAGSGGAGGAGGTSGAGASGGSVGESGAAGEGSTVPGVHFVGRVDTTDPAAARFAWSGTGVTARFQGTSVSAELEGGQEYTVVLDGEVKPKLTAMTGMNVVATDLADGEHVVELYRRTEASEGESVFKGFDFGGGTLLAPPPTPTRRLEFVGDSITCGYGIEGADMSCGFTPQTENHYLTYAALTARALAAEVSTVAWSGKGVVCNYGDDASSCMNPLPTYYDRTLPNRADSVWDFSRFQPDAVVVNLGTNDFSTTDDPTAETFQGAYVMLLQHIRMKYPNAHILITNGPMLSGTDLTTVRSNLTAVVATLADPKVTTFEIAAQDGSDGYGCDWHPSRARHEKVAELVTAALKSALGW